MMHGVWHHIMVLIAVAYGIAKGRDGRGRGGRWYVVGGGCGQIEESISILNFFPPNPGVDFYFEFLPGKYKNGGKKEVATWKTRRRTDNSVIHFLLLTGRTVICHEL
jgi:hypothetical protein